MSCLDWIIKLRGIHRLGVERQIYTFELIVAIENIVSPTEMQEVIINYDFHTFESIFVNKVSIADLKCAESIDYQNKLRYKLIIQGEI